MKILPFVALLIVQWCLIVSAVNDTDAGHAGTKRSKSIKHLKRDITAAGGKLSDSNFYFIDGQFHYVCCGKTIS